MVPCGGYVLCTTRVMKFYCTRCNNSDIRSMFQEVIQVKEEICESKNKIIENKDQIIANKEELINLLRKEIEKLKESTSQENIKISYHDAKVIEDKINPTILGVGVNKIKYVKEGGVAISCSKEQYIQNISESIKRKMGEEYEIKIPEKKNPKIKIFNIEKKSLEDPDVLIENIVIQNVICTPADLYSIMKILSNYENRRIKIMS
ncbi:hypothetical protein NQ318_004943 [Aromia moschata]|uniref:Uncharacterized protein n=1 Tax=Aromia moschata TaxID=1265417 RepID=A0AAV8XCB0_9CUCU|nr:hypothetical protein NQ318_004943 [Aromia moschata]